MPEIVTVRSINDPGERRRRLAELYRFFERPDAGRATAVKQKRAIKPALSRRDSVVSGGAS